MRPSIAYALLLLSTTTGCLSGSSNARKLEDTVHQIAMAQRFARLDVVVGVVAPKSREAFLEAHEHWENGVRILDLELGGIQMLTDTVAESHIRVEWQKLNDLDLRTSQVAQKWVQSGDAWLLEEERIVSGDKGLLLTPSEPKEGKKAKETPATSGNGKPSIAVSLRDGASH